jgi:hypothetical protein
VDDDTDAGVMAEYGTVVSWATANPQYTVQAKAAFSNVDKADAFLLAAARHYKCKVVTQEKSEPGAKIRIPIPDAGNALGVQSVTIYELLKAHASGTFTFKP